MILKRNISSGNEKNWATGIIRVWRENHGVVLARSLITSSNRETRIVPMYHEVRIVFAAYNYRPSDPPNRHGAVQREILNRIDRSPFLLKNARYVAAWRQSPNSTALVSAIVLFLTLNRQDTSLGGRRQVRELGHAIEIILRNSIMKDKFSI